ncbi:MAG: histidine phosphatase family protein [Acidimicrobiia bacterium]
MEVTLVRHAQTSANAAGVLQGQGQGSLTSLGEEQAEALSDRIDVSDYDVLLVSDLDRALATADALGEGFVALQTWRELNLGDWEGMTRSEVREGYAEELERMRSGEDIHFGGGESWEEFSNRVRSGFDDLSDGMEEGQRGLVVTHGGVINEVLRLVGGLPERSGRFGRSANTGITRLVREHGAWSLAVFNDATHLHSDPPYLRERIERGRQAAFLIRHGETDATDGRGEGESDQGLNAVGRSQADVLSDRVDAPVVFSSPMESAWETAYALNGSDPVRLAELTEMRKGTEGETWKEVGTRMNEGIEAALSSTDEARVAFVSHGPAIRAYLSRILHLPQRKRNRLAPVENASVSSLVFEERGPVIASFNVTF